MFYFFKSDSLYTKDKEKNYNKLKFLLKFIVLKEHKKKLAIQI